MQSYLGPILFNKRTLVFYAGESITGSVTFEGGSKGCKLFDVQIVLARHVDNPLEKPESKDESFATGLLAHHSDMLIGTIPVANYSFTDTENALTLGPNSSKKCAFDIKLPSTLWSTFHVQWGNIDYSLFIQMRTQTPFSSVKWFQLKKEIIVIGLVPPAPEPFTQALVEKQVYINKDGEEMASLTVIVDRTFAIPGEKFPFKVEIVNGTKLSLTNVNVIVQQNVVHTFNIQSRDKEIYQIVQKDGPSVPPGPDRLVNWSSNIDIPHVVPTGLGQRSCPCIKVNYELIFTLSNFDNLRVKLPFHIGTALTLEDLHKNTILLAYGLEMTRSEFSSLDLDSTSLTNGDSGFNSWSSVIDALSCYSSTTMPPPNYESDVEGI